MLLPERDGKIDACTADHAAKMTGSPAVLPVIHTSPSAFRIPAKFPTNISYPLREKHLMKTSANTEIMRRFSLTDPICHDIINSIKTESEETEQ